MQIDKEIFVNVATKYGSVEDALGRCEPTTSLWLVEQAIPDELKSLLEAYMPKFEVWAGAGAIFEETNIIKCNEGLPEALRSRLLIIGTAPNGDHIAIDLNKGATGYISHEHDWQQKPREYFIAVSPSIGSFLRDINENPPLVPDDYWDAIDARN